MTEGHSTTYMNDHNIENDVVAGIATNLCSLNADVELLQKLAMMHQAISSNGEKSSSDVAILLRRVYNSVAGLESQIQTMEEVLEEEECAIQHLERLRDQAKAQAEKVQWVSSHVPVVEVEDVDVDDNFSKGTEQFDDNMSEEVSEEKRILIHIKPLDREEFLGLARSVRGRVSLAAVNDATREIARTAQRKYDILSSGGKRVSGKGGSLENLRGRHIAGVSISEYRRVVAQHRKLQLDEHSDGEDGEGIWVSEQDIRELCNFFRIGESTARTILSILRSTKRLKQIPNKRCFTYKIL